MKLKEKLRLMCEIEKRNLERIKAFAAKPRKRHSSAFREKTMENISGKQEPK